MHFAYVTRGPQKENKQCAGIFFNVNKIINNIRTFLTFSISYCCLLVAFSEINSSMPFVLLNFGSAGSMLNRCDVYNAENRSSFTST